VLEVRFGLSSVPAFAPVGGEAEQYGARSWGPGARPEVVAHHAEHWPDVGSLAGFAPFLGLEAFDPAALLELAASAGLDVPPRLVCADGPAATDRARAVLADAARAGLGVEHPDEVDPRLPARCRRGLGRSLGWNAAEEDRDRLDAAGIVALVVDRVAAGEGVTLVVGLRADGAVPPPFEAALREAGPWLRQHLPLLAAAVPFEVPGDGDLHFLALTGSTGPTREVLLVDHLARPDLTVGHLSPHRYPVESVDGAAAWQQDTGGLHLTAPASSHHDPVLPVVYRVVVQDRRVLRLAVRGERSPGTVAVDGRTHASVTAALADARSGDVVRLGPGRWDAGDETFPLVVPPGVTLRGAAPGELVPGQPLGTGGDHDGSELDATASGAAGLVRLGAGAALEHLLIRAGGGTAIEAGDAAAVRVELCRLEGSVHLRGCPDAELRWNEVDGGGLVVVDSDRVAITGNRQRGDHLGVGLHVKGGSASRIDGNHFADDDGAIRLVATRETTVSANDASGTTAAVSLDDAVDVHVVGNHLAGGRTIAVHGGSGHLIATNVLDHADTGVVLDHRCTGVEITGNRFEGCRVGVLAWSHTGTTLTSNRFDGSRDHDVIDPRSDRR
jgi:hypothetical protein